MTWYVGQEGTTLDRLIARYDTEADARAMWEKLRADGWSGVFLAERVEDETQSRGAATPGLAPYQTVYGVSSGEYSDYTLHFVCASQELAEQYVQLRNTNPVSWNRYFVESLQYYTDVTVEPLRYIEWRYERDREGTITEAHDIREITTLDTEVFVGRPYYAEWIGGAWRLTMAKAISASHTDAWWIEHTRREGYDLLKQIQMMRQQGVSVVEVNAWLRRGQTLREKEA